MIESEKYSSVEERLPARQEDAGSTPATSHLSLFEVCSSGRRAPCLQQGRTPVQVRPHLTFSGLWSNGRRRTFNTEDVGSSPTSPS